MQKLCEIVKLLHSIFIHSSLYLKSIGDWNSMKGIIIQGLVQDYYNNNSNNNNNNNNNIIINKKKLIMIIATIQQ